MEKRVSILLCMHIPHVHHLASVAFELSTQKDLKVSVYGNPGSMEVFKKLSLLYPNHQCQVEIWDSKGYWKLTEQIKRKKIPNAKRLLKRNFEQIMASDMVISSDFYTDWLVDKKQGKKPIFVFGFHGAGDAEYGFNENLKKYDYLLLSGEKIKRRLENAGIIKNDEGQLVGYPKFDVAANRPRQVFFDNDKPVVLYNPHFQPLLSSWYKWGIEVLEYFYRQDQYNLIVAPHYNLYQGLKKSKRPIIPSKYFEARHIRIDKGSTYSIDMSYTMNADLYLGDVSSQVYEFLYHAKPCLFLNAHGVNWQEDINYPFWHFGPVLNDIKSLSHGLEQAFCSHENYLGKQEEGFDATFSRTNESAGKRAAIALSKILEKE